MQAFELKNWELIIEPTIWGLEPFKKILKRDKTKDKSVALKEMLFIYFFTDIRSDYLITPEKDRISEIKKDIGLPDKWEIDTIIQEAINFYREKSESPIERLYKASVNALAAVSNHLDKSEALLSQMDNNNKPVYDVSKITTAISKVPKLMSDLKTAYKEVVKEKEDNSNKKSGSKSFNPFEEGFDV